MYRSRKTTKAYNPGKTSKQLTAGEVPCPFCELDDRPVHKDGEAMRVVPNKHPYEYWDKRGVIEHLLLIPKRHVESLSELTDKEKVEAIELMSEYESAGYSVYWRSKTNGERTVPHQHTHLIKVNNVSPHLSIYSEKPYFVWNI
jgi:ATP adenylyltransferase